MTISNQKDLAKLIKLCRSLGVESIKVDNVEFHLGAVPTKSVSKRITKALVNDTFDDLGFTDPGQVPQMESIETPDELTPEQLLMWSAGGSAQDQGTF